MEYLSKHADVAVGCQHIAGLLSEHLISQSAAGVEVPPLARVFAAPSTHYLELMVSDDGTAVAVTTHGRGEQFTAQIQFLLRSCGIETAAAGQLLAMAAALNHGPCMAQLMLVSGSCPRLEVAVRYRRSMHLDHGLRMLHVEAAEALAVRGCADLLQKSSISGLTLSVRQGTTAVRQAVHFTHVVTEQRREAVRMRLAHAASRYAPCAAAVTRWAEHHDLLLSPHRHVLSMAFTPANSAHAAQVDFEYGEVPARAAARLVEHQATAATERFELLCTRADRSNLSYLEVSLQAAKLPVLRGYARVSL